MGGRSHYPSLPDVQLHIVDAPSGAGPESITTPALAACRIRGKPTLAACRIRGKNENGALVSAFCANGPGAKRAGSMDSGLARCARRNDDLLGTLRRKLS
jgi:hypothetical protein